MGFFDGGFPFSWWENVLAFDGGFPLGKGEVIPPMVLSASASEGGIVQAKTVLVEYSEDVVHVNPANANDALNPTNYVFAGGPAPAITAVSVVLSSLPNTYRVTLSREMTLGYAMTVTVSNVESATTGLPVTPPTNVAAFASGGVQPRIIAIFANASKFGPTGVTIVFDEVMLNDAVLQNPANYVFAGVPALVAVSAHRTTQFGYPLNTAIAVVTNDQLTGAPYSVTVSNVTDLVGNVVDPAHDTIAFVGYGTTPTVTGAAQPTTLAITVDFSETVRQVNPANADDALNPANYVCGKWTKSGLTDLLTLDSVTSLAGNQVQVNVSHTTPPDPGVWYRIYAYNIKDIAGNTLSATVNYGNFTAMGTGVPQVTFWPADGYVGLAIDTPAQINIVDLDPSSSGIDMTSLDVTIDMGVQTHDIIVGGVVNPVWDVVQTGDPADPVGGVTLRISPHLGRWPAETDITLHVYVEDTGGAAEYAYSSFRTGESPYLEDAVLEPITDLERKLVYGFVSKEANAVRRKAMTTSVTSKNARIAARAVIRFATETGLMAYFQTLFPTYLLDGIISTRAQAADFGNGFTWFTSIRPLFSEVGVNLRIVDTLDDRFRSGDPVLKASAVAAALVKIALEEIDDGVW